MNILVPLRMGTPSVHPSRSPSPTSISVSVRLGRVWIGDLLATYGRWNTHQSGCANVTLQRRTGRLSHDGLGDPPASARGLARQNVGDRPGTHPSQKSMKFYHLPGSFDRLSDVGSAGQGTAGHRWQAQISARNTAHLRPIYWWCNETGQVCQRRRPVKMIPSSKQLGSSFPTKESLMPFDAI